MVEVLKCIWISARIYSNPTPDSDSDSSTYSTLTPDSHSEPWNYSTPIPTPIPTPTPKEEKNYDSDSRLPLRFLSTLVSDSEKKTIIPSDSDSRFRDWSLNLFDSDPDSKTRKNTTPTPDSYYGFWLLLNSTLTPKAIIKKNISKHIKTMENKLTKKSIFLRRFEPWSKS